MSKITRRLKKKIVSPRLKIIPREKEPFTKKKILSSLCCNILLNLADAGEKTQSRLKKKNPHQDKIKPCKFHSLSR